VEDRWLAAVEHEVVVLAVAVDVDRQGSFSRGVVRQQQDTHAYNPESLAERECGLAHRGSLSITRRLPGYIPGYINDEQFAARE
jgi:hypothetical protein